MSFTSEQIDEMMAFAEHNFPEDAPPLPLDIDGLQKNFNAEMRIFLDKCQFDDAEVAEVMEKLFLISGEFLQIFDLEHGKFFFNVFGDRTAIFGVSGADDRFGLLTCVYVMPDTKDEDTLSSMILATFTKILLPAVEFVDTEKFLRELAAEKEIVRDGIKFFIASDGKLIFVTALAQ